MRLYRWGAGLANVGKDVVDDCGIGAGALKRAQGPLTTAAERAYGDIELEAKHSSVPVLVDEINIA